MLRKMGFVAVIIGVLAVGTPAHGQGTGAFGVVIDANTKKATVFDTSTDTVVGSSAALGPVGTFGDCSIVGKFFFATGFDRLLHVGSLKSGAVVGKPIHVGALGEDTAVVKRGHRRFVVVAGSQATDVPISVVDASRRRQVAQHFTNGTDNDSLSAGPDGSVLTPSRIHGAVHRFTIKRSGKLSDTPNSLAVVGPVNLVVPPTGRTAIVLGQLPNEAVSFSLPLLLPTDSRTFTDEPNAGVFRPDGLRVYIKTSDHSANSHILAFNFDPSTGAFSTAGGFSTIAFTSNGTLQDFNYGEDQIGINASGTKLYVSAPNAVKVYDAATGLFLNNITSPNIVAPTGLCFAGTNS